MRGGGVTIHTDTLSHTLTHRYTQGQSYTHSHMHSHTQRYTYIDTQTDTDTHTHTETLRHTHSDDQKTRTLYDKNVTLSCLKSSRPRDQARDTSKGGMFRSSDDATILSSPLRLLPTCCAMTALHWDKSSSFLQ